MDRNELADSIDLLENCDSRTTGFGGGSMAVSWRCNSLHRSSAVYEDSGCTAYFSGDLIDYDEVPWKLILNSVKNGVYKQLNQLIGVFVIAVLDKADRKLYLITDQISQAPFFLKNSGSSLVFSTSIATFCRLTESPRINRQWIYEFMYFNYAVGKTSILEDVSRISAASIVEIDIDELTCNTTQFGGAHRYADSTGLCSRKEQLQRAIEVFEDRIPRYFIEEDKQAISLTGGLDSQTVISFAPRDLDPLIETYTYGVPGCNDLQAAARLAPDLGLPHHEILFDDRFLSALGQTMDEAMYLAGGLEKVVRSTVLYVYRTLTEDGTKFPVVTTGISGDHVFRDHLRGTGNVPMLISADMMASIHTGSFCMDEGIYAKAFGKHYVRFREHIHSVIHALRDYYGELTNPVSFLRFLLFEVGPRCFVGESVIASHFTALRSPYWDSHVHKLAFELDYSTLGFSKFFPKAKDEYRECVFQARAIAERGTHGIRAVKSMPIWAYTCDNKAVFMLARLMLRGPQKLRKLATGYKYAPLEDWTEWFKGVLRAKFEQLLGGDCLISEYINRQFISEVKNGDDLMLMQRLITSEIVFRLVSNGWRKLSTQNP